MSTTTTHAPTGAPTASRLRWRVVDIVTASVLAVACGLLFVLWNGVGGAWFGIADAVTPGFGGIAVGPWLIGGVIGGLVIRKPGAALFVELLAANVSTLLGSQWGIETVYSGLAQGLGAELIFAVLLYRRFGVVAAMASGVGAAVAAWTLELFLSANLAKGPEFLGIYLGALALSGAVLAGLLGWLIVRGLAATGALSRFAAGREAQRRT